MNYLEVQGCKHCGHRPASEKHLCDLQSTQGMTDHQLKMAALEVWGECDMYDAFDYLIQTVREQEQGRIRKAIEAKRADNGTPIRGANLYSVYNQGIDAALSVVTSLDTTSRIHDTEGDVKTI
jgi:hypothetical protein